LNGIKDNKANLTIEYLHEEIKAEAGKGVAAEENKTTTPAGGEGAGAGGAGAGGEGKKGGAGKAILWIVIIVVIALVVYFAARAIARRKNNVKITKIVRQAR
jgi:hypothetical protein